MNKEHTKMKRPFLHPEKAVKENSKAFALKSVAKWSIKWVENHEISGSDPSRNKNTRFLSIFLSLGGKLLGTFIDGRQQVPNGTIDVHANWPSHHRHQKDKSGSRYYRYHIRWHHERSPRDRKKFIGTNRKVISRLSFSF